jgi:curli production assembly/transport component CsgG
MKLRSFLLVLAGLALSGCAIQPATIFDPAKLTPKSAAYKDLRSLPEPKGRIAVAVYSLRDQTGQYKPAPDSSFSTAVTQGGAALLVRALLESNWFVPVERENFQNLLTERKILRALENPPDKAEPKPAPTLPPLMPASILIEGGVVAYESNVRTGGAGARYLGVSLSTQYRIDLVTVNLRAVDVRSGQVLHSVSTTKTIYSQLLDSGVFKFVDFKQLLELEVGYSRNEPTQLCVNEAIESAVMHLIVQGLGKHLWQLKNPEDINHPLLQAYLAANDAMVEAPKAIE